MMTGLSDEKAGEGVEGWVGEGLEGVGEGLTGREKGKGEREPAKESPISRELGRVESAK